MTLRPLLLAAALAWPAAATPRPPDILVIVADDLALSDLGAFGGEIATPNLDALAAEGLRFADFHVSPACAPTRAMLLTGTDHHRVGVATMVEVAAPNQRGQPGYDGFLSPRAVTLGEIFARAGYHTIYSGKWHLGFQPHADPHARGFADSLALLHGAHDHFGGGYSPDSRFGNSVSRNGQILAELPADFYSSTAFADHMIGAIAAVPVEQPFLGILSFSAPHWPVQAPAADIARQRGRYDAGWASLAEARLARQKSLGLAPAHAAVPPPARTSRGWASLPPGERAREVKLMEVYAAMVERMDLELGRVLAELKRQGRDENILILFLSDNGPESLDFRTTNLTPLTDRWKAARNALNEIGGPGSFEAYGPGWAEGSAAPGRMFKAWATEGGTRAPLILRPPRGAASAMPGAVVSGFAHVMDIVPTLMDYAGIADHGPRFAGRAVEPIRGRTLRAMIEGRADRSRPEGVMVAGELFGQRSVFDGRWKALDTGDGWRLFDLVADPSEQLDLATREPDRLLRMTAYWEAWAREVQLVMPVNPPYRP